MERQPKRTSCTELCPSQRLSDLRPRAFPLQPGVFICKEVGGGALRLVLPAVPELGSDHRHKSAS